MQYKNLGIYIKEKRIKAGKGLNNFAFVNQIEPAILSRIENLKQDIKFQILVKIAKGFNMKVSEFIDEFENKNK